MSGQARRILQIWRCPHCQEPFKVEHPRMNLVPPERVTKWSYCPKGFMPNGMEWVCPHCQKYVTPVDRFRMTKNNQCVRIDQEWNTIHVREASSDALGKFETTVELLPFVKLRKVNEIVSHNNYPRSAESVFRLYIWQESCWLSQCDEDAINQRKKVLLKDPLQYFYYVLFRLRGGEKQKLTRNKKFEDVQRLMQDEAALKQRMSDQQHLDKPNMHRLLNLLGDDFERAEIFRQLGMFKECIEALKLVEAQFRFEVKLKKEMLKRAKRKDTGVFEVKGSLDEEHDT